MRFLDKCYSKDKKFKEQKIFVSFCFHNSQKLLVEMEDLEKGGV